MPEQTPAKVKLHNADEIHLWQIHVTDDQYATEHWLSSQELARYRSFTAPLLARRYLAFRCSLRHILGTYLDAAPQELDFSSQQGGKPVILSPDHDLHFNLTHTGDNGLLAIARSMPVGIDMERIRSLKTRHAIARRVFAAAEVMELEEMPESEQDECFFQLWTCMEARQKCAGNGVFGDRIDKQSVGLHQFQPLTGYCAAIAWGNPSAQPALHFFNQSDSPQMG